MLGAVLSGPYVKTDRTTRMLPTMVIRMIATIVVV